MKRIITLLITALLVLTFCATAIAEEEPDFSSMTSSEWFEYEFFMDYSTLLTDVTSYDHEYVRNEVLGLHWAAYFAVAEDSELSEEERLAAVSALHDARVATPMISNPEESRLYLWPRGQVPSTTEYTENPGYAYNDAPDFEPFMIECLVEEGMEIKGAVLIAPGGGHMFRSNIQEGIEVAMALNALGYQCFIVNYRIDPYTDEESALDIARAVKIVRANAEKYGIKDDQIACVGFSYGGIVGSLAADRYNGDKNASEVVEGYTPDEIDATSADVNVYLAVYSVTPDEILNEKFPPTFFFVGNDDGVMDWVMRCFDLVREAGIRYEIHTVAGVPHGFGAGKAEDGTVFENAAVWPLLADAFMQDIYTAEP